MMPDLSDPAVMQSYLDWGLSMGFGTVKALFILALGWLFSKSAHRMVMAATSRYDQAVAGFIASMARYTVLATAMIAALGAVGVETTSVVAIFASAGLAVGLALQGSLANFASGVMVLIFRPFELGDVVSAGGSTGVVTDIGLFATTLTTPDNHIEIIPNAAVTGGTIVNYTRNGTRRGGIDFGVAYGADLKVVQAAAEKAVASCDLVLEDPAVSVVFTEMAASSLNFTVLAWANCDTYLAMLDQVRRALYDELNAQGIEIPFDQLVVHQAA
jgi:small conductance mechanosensitive channel